MTRTPVTSALLTSVGYDPQTRTLEVEFAKNGKVYRYDDVPPETAADLLGAESVGGHFLRHVKPQNFACTVVAPDQKPAA